MTSRMPRYGQAFLLPNGSIAPVWYDYLRSLDASSLTAEIERQVQANTEAIKALQQAGFGDYLPASAFVLGINSVETFGELKDGARVMLRGDVALPNPTTYYGADQDQERGFHPVSDAIEAAEDELTKDVDAGGVTTLGLPEITPAPGGTLQRYGFDDKGRRTHEEAADTDDLAEGATNLYFTDERARSAAVTDAIDPLATDTAPSGRAVAEAIEDIDLSGYAELAGDNEFSGDNDFLSRVTVGGAARIGSEDLGVNVAAYSSSDESTPLALFDGPSFATSTANMIVGGGVGFAAQVAQGNLIFVSSTGIAQLVGTEVIFGHTIVRPMSDGNMGLGGGPFRWSEVFSANGAINTSDAREKTESRELTEAEMAAAADIARLPCIFQWLHAIEEKGEDARLHAGPTVQAVIAAMEARGLDPFRYGFVCYDKWGYKPAVIDEATGNELEPELEAGDRYSLRPTELANFVLRGLSHRQDELEQRLAALESE